MSVRDLLRLLGIERMVSALWHFFSQPRFIWGVPSPSGFLRHTRYGSSTVILNKDKLKLGDHVYIGQYCFIDAQAGVEIGEGCQICYWVSILNHSSHVAVRLYGKEFVKQKTAPKAYFTDPVKIGAYTFVGPHAVLMPGTTIGKGSLVTAFSLVQGHFPDFSMIAGNPAQRVGDTREMDKGYLEKYPELETSYNEWVQRL